MVHPNAPLTPEGRRRLAILVVQQGWTVRRAAERFQCSSATASRWVGRYRAGEPLTDRRSRPHRSPARRSRRTERRIVGLRVSRQWGPHRIGYHLGLPRSTVGRVLGRYGLPLLAHVDRATGQRVRAPKPVRYEAEHPGELVHMDKGLGCMGRIALGIVGAIVGGFIVSALGFDTGRERGDILNLASIIVAVFGAIVVVLIANLLRGRRA